MIQVKDLCKTFSSGTKAIDHLSLEVREGEILALLGPNGAGKTTTIRVLSTLSGFDEGEVIVAGHNVDIAPDQVRSSIGLVAQQTGVDYFLSGRENLLVQGQMYRMKKADIEQRIDELAKYFDLEQALDNQIMTYSGGMRRKLDIATALIHKPKLLFLDEPTLGLDIKSRQSLWQYIRKLNREDGLTILLTTHYLEEADKLSNRVAIIHQGKIQVIDSPDALKSAIHGDAVILNFVEQGTEVGEFTFAMHQDPDVKEVLWQNDKLYLYVDNGGQAVPKFVALASQQGLTIDTLSLARPSLDDVFLKYTGSTMDDNKEDEGEEWWHQWAGKGGGSGKWAKNWEQWQDQLEESGDTDAQQDWSAQWQKWQQNDGSETSTADTTSQGNPWWQPSADDKTKTEDKDSKAWPGRWPQGGGDDSEWTQRRNEGMNAAKQRFEEAGQEWPQEWEQPKADKTDDSDKPADDKSK